MRCILDLEVCVAHVSLETYKTDFDDNEDYRHYDMDNNDDEDFCAGDSQSIVVSVKLC